MVVIDHMAQSDAFAQQMVEDMGQEIDAVEFKCRDAESPFLVFVGETGIGMVNKPFLEALVVEGIAHPRGAIVHFDGNLAGVDEIDVVVDAAETGDDGVDVGYHLLVAAFHPNVDVARGAHERCGVE